MRTNISSFRCGRCLSLISCRVTHFIGSQRAKRHGTVRGREETRSRAHAATSATSAGSAATSVHSRADRSRVAVGSMQSPCFTFRSQKGGSFRRCAPRQQSGNSFRGCCADSGLGCDHGNTPVVLFCPEPSAEGTSRLACALCT